MRTALVYGLIGWIAVIVQSSILDAILPNPFKPDIPFLLVLFAAITQPLWTGIFCVVFCGYIVGIFSGGPVSLWILVYMVCFFASKPMVRWFSPDSRVLHVTYPFVFTFIKMVLLIIGFRALSRESGPLSWILQGALGEAVLNSAAAFLLYPFLKYSGRTRHAAFE